MYSDIMFHNNLSSGIQVVPRGRTDMTKKYSHFTILRNRPLMMNMSAGVFPQTLRETTEIHLQIEEKISFSIHYHVIISNI